MFPRISNLTRKSLAALGLAVVVAGTIGIARRGAAQSAGDILPVDRDLPPLMSSCTPDMNVTVVRIPHHEDVVFVSPAGSAHAISDPIFTHVPSGWSFRVTHISATFFSESNQAYHVALVRYDPNAQQLAAFSPNEDGLHPQSYDEYYRSGNYPWDASYPREAGTEYRLFVTRLSSQAKATTRAHFDGYLEQTCSRASGQ